VAIDVTLSEKINLVLGNVKLDVKKYYNIVFSDINLDVKMFFEMFLKTLASVARPFCDINFDIHHTQYIVHNMPYIIHCTLYIIHNTQYIIFNIMFHGLKSHLLCVYWHEKTNYLYKWDSGREDKTYKICEFSEFFKVVEVDVAKKIRTSQLMS